MKNTFLYLLIHIHKYIGLPAILLVAPIAAMGQFNIGVGAGISRNFPAGNPINRPLTGYAPINGFATTIVLQYPLNRFITIGAEPSLVGKHHKTVRNGYYQGVYETTYNNYIQLPVLLTFSVSYKRILGGVTAGGYSAYWAHSRKKGEIPNLSNLSLQDGNYTNVFQNMQSFSYDETYHFDSKTDQRWEFGWVAGLDFQYTLLKQVACFVAARYYYSLTGQGKEYSINQEQRFNETIVYTTGLLFKINRPKNQ